MLRTFLRPSASSWIRKSPATTTTMLYATAARVSSTPAFPVRASWLRAPEPSSTCLSRSATLPLEIFSASSSSFSCGCTPLSHHLSLQSGRTSSQHKCHQTYNPTRPFHATTSRTGPAQPRNLSATPLCLLPPSAQSTSPAYNHCRRTFASFRTPSGGRGGNNRFSMLATLGAAGSLVLAKGKYVLVALKLTKLTPLISMIGTSLAYSYIFGWQYGVGMVALIFVHETGHALAMLHYKIPFSPMVFIPFLGASISMKELPANSVQDSMIAIAGPVAGSLAAFCCMIMGDYSGGQIWYALADFGFMINLFNLMPIGQMDGGRIGNAIHPSFGVAGVVLGASLLWNGYIHNPIVILFILSGAYSSLSRYMGWSTVPESFYRISSTTQIQLALMYFAVVIVLCLCMLENNKRRKTPKQLQAGRHQSYGGLESLMNADDDDARWR